MSSCCFCIFGRESIVSAQRDTLSNPPAIFASYGDCHYEDLTYTRQKVDNQHYQSLI